MHLFMQAFDTKLQCSLHNRVDTQDSLQFISLKLLLRIKE